MKINKHRPESLNLESLTDGNNADVALRLVSPGLPPLNKQMKVTVKLSQRIEQQQKSLIAARQSLLVSPPSEYTKGSKELKIEDNYHQKSDSKESESERVDANESDNEKSQNKTESREETASSETSTKREIDDEEEKTNIPLGGAKRLRRSNIPSPLRLSSSPKDRHPVIQSAPIRYGGRFYQASQPRKRPYYPGMVPQMVPLAHANVPYVSAKRRQFRPFHNTKVTHSAFPPVRMLMLAPQTGIPSKSTYPAPFTTMSQHFPGRISVAGVREPAGQQSAKPAPGSVTDVFHGDYTSAAPLESQPLSAQKNYFWSRRDKQTQDDDRDSASDGEMKEMSRKYEDSAVNEPMSDESSDDNDNEREEFFGSINLMNESIFNFRIYKQSPTRTAFGSSPGDDFLHREIPSSHTSPPSTPASEPSQLQEKDIPENKEKRNDWLAEEKKKFLKICETSWDKFVTNRFGE